MTTGQFQGRRRASRCARWAAIVLLAGPGCADGSGVADSATSGTSMTSESSGSTGGIGAGAQPRWVLRDADGVRIQALVEPRCGQVGSPAPLRHCLPVDFGEGGWLQCVRVVNHEGRYINLLYDLQTGEIGPCMYNPGDEYGDITKPWTEIRGMGLDKPGCQGSPYLPDGLPKIQGARRVYFADGEIWYEEEQGCIVGDFWRLEALYQCVSSTGYFCPVKVIPEWVQGLLPNPPYTLDVEYE